MGAPSGDQVELVLGEQRAVVVEVGGGLRSYARGDWHVLDGYLAGEMCTGARGQPLIPWPNRLRAGRYTFAGAEQQVALSEPEQGNALHGLVRWGAWHVGERAADRVIMHHVLHAQPGYPFRLELSIAYELSPGGLSITTSAANAGDDACPVGFGAHPYLSAGGETIDGALLRAPGAHWMRTDEHQIPTGREPVDGTHYDFREERRIGETVLDTGYSELEREDDGLAWVRLRDPDAGREAALWLGPEYRHLMLFTGDTLPERGRRRRGLGVEPMTCPPNAFATGEDVRVLEPGEVFTARWGISASA